MLGLALSLAHSLLVRVRGAGPELAPAANSGAWTLSGTTPPTQDASGIRFNAASNLAAAAFTVPIVSDATYLVRFTVANYVGGAARVLVYGAAANKLGATQNVSANGTYTVMVTTSATGSLTNQIRIQATGTSGTNTFAITGISVKRIF